VFWDQTCDPMPQHGVTTVLTGNCALSLAPLKPKAQDQLIDIFCYIEDLDPQLFAEQIPWNWESFAEYLDSADDRPGSLNLAPMVGHNLLRLFVMGEQAWMRAADSSERLQIARLLDETMQAGAFGLSACLGFDTDRTRRPVPARLADDSELGALMEVNRPGFGSASFGRMSHAPSVPAGVPAASAQDARGVDS
jgi:N-acyl-D-amino-acid deacylase